ncbi:MAG TPA: hypothetical protein PLP27_12570 [Crocinitomicaceae bacterium]|nr:hypothetical protein [Crocinitomicaceae bacterium]
MKHLITIIFISLTHFSFGQKVIYGELGHANTDVAFINLEKNISSYARNYLNVLIEPTDTIVVPVSPVLGTYYDKSTNKKFQLKYVLIYGSPPTFKECLKSRGLADYWCASYGDKYVIIAMFLNTGSFNHAEYYYELIAEE